MALAEAALAFWFLLPAYAANPMAVVFGGGTPMDFGRSLRDGRR
ncbi:MAG TPA: CDP-archaeol synthase, partial [Thermoplasmata archaeon]